MVIRRHCRSAKEPTTQPGWPGSSSERPRADWCAHFAGFCQQEVFSWESAFNHRAMAGPTRDFATCLLAAEHMTEDPVALSDRIRVLEDAGILDVPPMAPSRQRGNQTSESFGSLHVPSQSGGQFRDERRQSRCGRGYSTQHDDTKIEKVIADDPRPATTSMWPGAIAGAVASC